MAEIKPLVEPAEVLSLLGTYFEAPIDRITPIQGGHIARTFSFHGGGRNYVIRFTTDEIGAAFGKEAFIQQHLPTVQIPIPPILQVGQFKNLTYAISPEFPGQPLDQVAPSEYHALVPSVIEMLDKIHQVDVRLQGGYGQFDAQGVGMFSSWRSYLASIREEEAASGFYGNWHDLFENSFLERKLFELIYRQMTQLLYACPEERWLVHGDYGFNNVLVQQGTITAVLDWANAKYGDHIYDVAWLHFWSPGTDFQTYFQRYYDAKGRAVDHYEERLRCYACFISLDALRFFAKSENQNGYQWVRHRIQEMLV